LPADIFFYSSDDIKRILLDKQINEGGYGIIYKGRWRETIVAVKVLKTEGMSENNIRDYPWIEAHYSHDDNDDSLYYWNLETGEEARKITHLRSNTEFIRTGIRRETEAQKEQREKNLKNVKRLLEKLQDKMD